MITTESNVETNGQLAEQQAWIERSLSGAAPVPLVVEGLDITRVGELHGALVERLGGGGELVIDLGAVESTDAAGLQLLVTVCQEAMRLGRPARLAGVTESLVQSASLLGLSADLGLAPAA